MLTREIEACKRLHDHVMEESDRRRSRVRSFRSCTKLILKRFANSKQCKGRCLVTRRAPQSGRPDLCACAHLLLLLRKDKVGGKVNVNGISPSPVVNECLFCIPYTHRHLKY